VIPETSRRHPFVHLAAEEIGAMLEPAFGRRRVVAAEPLTDGASTTSYRVALEGLEEAYVLRIFARDPTACRKELDITRLVAGTVPIAEIVDADPDGARHGRPYSVSRWIDGVKLDRLLEALSGDEVDQLGSEVGRVLGRIATFRFPRAGFFGPGLEIERPLGDSRQWFVDFVEGCLATPRAQERLGNELTAAVCRLVRSNVHRLDVLEGVASLVHGDYRAWNLLLAREARVWRIVAVLDWEFAHAGTPLLDLGGLLRDERRLPPGFESALVHGFSEVDGPLPAGWKPLVKLLDLSSLCELVVAPREAGPLVEQVCERIATTVREWPGS
jgi:aminoglycoside phosphotransferase (APT) family kinase protein